MKLKKSISPVNTKPHPIEAIKFRMEQMDWSQRQLADMTKYSPSRISEFINGKRKITLEFIRAYHRIAPETPLSILIQRY